MGLSSVGLEQDFGVWGRRISGEFRIVFNLYLRSKHDVGIALKTAKNPATIATLFIVISAISPSPSSATLSSRLLSSCRQRKEPNPRNVNLADGTISGL